MISFPLYIISTIVIALISIVFGYRLGFRAGVGYVVDDIAKQVRTELEQRFKQIMISIQEEEGEDK